MSSNEVFSEQLSDIENVREPFRSALLSALKDNEKTRTLLLRSIVLRGWVQRSSLIAGDYGQTLANGPG
jgi:hypothetical protein